MTKEPDEVLDWDDMAHEDRERALELYLELNEIFDKYSPKKEEKPRETDE
jgi:hypothetical protein